MHRGDDTAKLEIAGISKTFETPGKPPVAALGAIDARIAPGEFVCLVGPSGCGKSTLFNIIAGLEQASSGAVLCDGSEVTGKTGVVGYQLQKDLLLPWRTVLDNIILGMELRNVPKREARAQVLPLLARYGLAGFENNYPSTLSGGMRQRAALMRTLLYDKDVILLDEPFGALDAQTRALMQEWLLSVWAESGKTILFITHDVEEALFLADRVWIMSARPGILKAQLDVPIARPRTQDTLVDPQFIALKRQVLTQIREESRRAFETR